MSRSKYPWSGSRRPMEKFHEENQKRGKKLGRKRSAQKIRLVLDVNGFLQRHIWHACRSQRVLRPETGLGKPVALPYGEKISTRPLQ